MDLNVGVAGALGDYFYIREQLTPAQLDHLGRARDFVTTEVQPVINRYWERAEFPWPLHTFEGTETIQTLIVGRDITGIGAFT